MFVDFTLEKTCEDLGGDLEGMASELRESEGEGDRTAYELKVINSSHLWLLASFSQINFSKFLSQLIVVGDPCENGGRTVEE